MSVADTVAPVVAQHPGTASMFSPLLIMAVFIAFLYFAVIRPQSRRRKEHAKLLNDIAMGDEVLTIGGMVGRVNKLRDDFVELTIAKETNIVVQKSAIANILPKGTMDV